MKYGDFNINQAAGIVLCSDIVLGEKFYAKGHVINQEDIAVFKTYGIRSLFGAEFEEGDANYKIALHQTAAHICGKGLGYLTESDGVCRIAASADGIFVADESRLDRFNSFNEHFILNTIPPHSSVKKGDIIAALEITPPLVSEAEIDDMIFRLSGNDSLLSLSPINKKKTILVYPHLLNDEDENRHFTAVVMKLVTNLEGLGFDFSGEISGRYSRESVADSLLDAFKQKADVVFVLSPLRSSGRGDVIASGVKMVADDIVNAAQPQIGASDLLIAQKGIRKIIVVPHAYDMADTSAMDGLIKHAVFTPHLSEASFAHKRSVRLDEIDSLPAGDIKRLIMPNSKTSANKADIGIVILAAGQGRRSGSNKLMVENKDGQPLFMRAVNAAIASDAKPVFVVTGFRHEEMEEWLDKLDINVLYNPAFAAGIKTSISMGLKSMPLSCDGAILLPADMPNITAADLNKLIDKFDKSAEKQLCMLACKGIKSNPVLWSRSLYDKADIVPENAQIRVIFAEHADYTQTLEVRDKKKLFDVNFPNDVKIFAGS